MYRLEQITGPAKQSAPRSITLRSSVTGYCSVRLAKARCWYKSGARGGSVALVPAGLGSSPGARKIVAVEKAQAEGRAALQALEARREAGGVASAASAKTDPARVAVTFEERLNEAKELAKFRNDAIRGVWTVNEQGCPVEHIRAHRARMERLFARAARRMGLSKFLLESPRACRPIVLSTPRSITLEQPKPECFER